MPTFEYVSFREKLTDADLDRLGALGWELVSGFVTQNPSEAYFVFKRPLP